MATVMLAVMVDSATGPNRFSVGVLRQKRILERILRLFSHVPIIPPA